MAVARLFGGGEFVGARNVVAVRVLAENCVVWQTLAEKIGG